MSSPSRRDEILNTALKLFNEQGSANVSTRHIAEAMGISPGNLYYYFPHKEAIIHAILDRAEALFEGVYDFDSAHLPSPKSLLKRGEHYFWEYRFFQSEMMLLFQNDPSLKERFGKLQQKRLKEIEKMLGVLQGAGILRPLKEELKKILTQNLWIVSNFWNLFLEIEGRLFEEETKGVIENILALLKPHMTREGIAWILLDNEHEGVKA